jgi:DNA-binding transcriptional MerR regulator
VARDQSLLQIGEVAERVGLSLRTVRYWGEIGLVRPSARSEGGFRLYSDADVERLPIVKQMKPFGLTLDEMGELLDLVERDMAADAAEHPELIERLQSYAARGDARMAKIERELREARVLRARIDEQLARAAVAPGPPAAGRIGEPAPAQSRPRESAGP